MITILAKVQVEDFAKFIGVFSTRGLAKRREHGCLRSQLFRSKEVPTVVNILFDWDGSESFRRFLDDPTVKETMKSGGLLAPPEFTFVERAGEFSG